jgi:DNA-binding transcriptional ArsR family regulator
LNKKQILRIESNLFPSRKLLERQKDREDYQFIILAPHIPSELAADFRKQALNHADLNGRLFIRAPDLLLDREPKTTSYANPTSEPDLFSPKASRLVRALVSHRNRIWNQDELVKRTGISPGLISRLLKSLTGNAYVSREYSGKKLPITYRLREFNRLLDTWSAEDQWRKRVSIQQYSLLENDMLQIARTTRDSLGLENVFFTQWFAAHLRHPYTTPPLVSAYIKRNRSAEIPFARKVESGGNLWLFVPQDEGVFLEAQEVDGFRLVSDVQIYLDLLQVGQRGPDQAEALLNWEGFAQ